MWLFDERRILMISELYCRPTRLVTNFELGHLAEFPTSAVENIWLLTLLSE
jgi:hypothetical protein